MLKIEYIKASELTPNPNNAKLHPDAQIAQIMRSIKEYGMDDPIAVWGEDNMIIEGHGRLLACEKLGIEEVPIIRLDHLTDKQRRAYTLIHNQLTMNSGFDVQKLTAELEAIGDNLIEYGFDIKPFQEIIEDEPANVEEETFSEQGKCYRLGDHLIYCGSFEDAAVADMFAKEKATCYGRGKGGKFTDSRKLSNVWFFDKPRSNKDHPTMKPIGLCAKGVLAMSEPGDIVFDPFSGSGSTMIACQQTGRRCYGCELDPRYADVIRKRYVKFTTGSEDNWQELTPEEEL